MSQTNLHLLVDDDTTIDRALSLDPTFAPAICEQLERQEAEEDEDEDEEEKAPPDRELLQMLSRSFARGFQYAGYK